MTFLKGHTTKETAFVVDDYPYGFRLRCRIRYWLEYDKKHGFRLVSQTTNPNSSRMVAGEVWNKPKASTYVKIAACMYLDEKEHVQWVGLSEYSSYESSVNFFKKYEEGMSDMAVKCIRVWIAMKKAYESGNKA